MNIAMLLLAATNLAGRDGTDTISGAHTAIAAALGPTIAVLFAVGLLASGLASTSVGAYAGAEIMRGLLRTRIPLLVRRLVTLTPALLLLATDVPPTSMLVISQVVLSFGIPFALIPLVLATRDAGMMGARRNGALLHLSACAIAAVIVVLNITLLTLTIVG